MEEALQRLSRVMDEAERHTLAQALAQRGERLVPVLLRHLGTTNPLLRGAVGLVAHYMDRDIIAPPLRDIAANPQRSDQERMAALMILERFLDEPVEESLYASLRDPEAVLKQSLREVVEYQHDVPDIVLDYITQLQEEPPDVALAVLDLMRAFPQEETVPLLRLLALDIREPVAEVALRRLGQTSDPAALAALVALSDLLTTSLRGEAERSARKLRLRGVSLSPAPRATWRCLATPPDLHGTQAFWLLRREEGDRWRLVGVLGNADLGVQFAFALPEVPEGFVPEDASEPVLLPVALENAVEGMAWFAEVAPAHVRRWLQRLTAQNYRSDYQMPVVYREHILTFWQETADAGIAPPPPLPEPAPHRLNDTLGLLTSPAMASWYVDPPRSAFQERRWIQSRMDVEALYAALREIPADAFSPDVWSQVAHRAEQLAEWLVIVGQHDLAVLAVTAAHALRTVPYEQNPFAQALVARGLAFAFEALHREKQRWDD